MNSAFLGPSANIWIILAGAVVTYLTRIGGHLVFSRIKHIPPRLNVALNAVPAAVIATMVAPGLVQGGAAETLTLIACAIFGLRVPMLGMFMIGWVLIVSLRATGL